MAHWYSSDGNCAYTQIAKSGKERATTLADARKLKLWPSVTEIINVKASPGLDVYKQSQLLNSVLDNIPYVGMSSLEVLKWKSEVIRSSKQHAADAAKRGSEIHDTLEQYYKTERYQDKVFDFFATAVDGTPSFVFLSNIVNPVILYLFEKFPNARWVAEKSFCNTEYGYGGKVDLHDPVNKIVLDFKTKDTDDTKKMQAYESHHMQSAAYAVGLSASIGDASEWKRYNLFISTQVPGLLNLTESTNFERDWGMFYSLLRYKQLADDHYPEKYSA